MDSVHWSCCEAGMDFEHHQQPDKPRVLIIEDDPAMLQRIITSIARPCCVNEAMLDRFDATSGNPVCCGCATDEAGDRGCCTVVGSLRQLYRFDLSKCDIIICASGLADGSGLDALAYIRGIAPTLPVMLTGEPSDTPLAVEAIRAGAADFLVNTESELRTLPLTIEKCLAQQRIKRENERLQNDLSRSLAETAVKNRQLQALIHQLETMARTDDLTGLYNRRWLNLMLERIWAESLRNGRPMAFMMIDLDGFKSVNDELGHQYGDDILRLSAKVIEANCRQVDHVARYGGDEFCILMPETEPHEATAVARRVLDAFTKAIGGRRDVAHLISMSIGISHISLSRPANITQLIAHADEALYAAKADGKNTVRLRDSQGHVSIPTTWSTAYQDGARDLPDSADASSPS
jgi:diguanylate cyclase (GGDEF)-like protein